MATDTPARLRLYQYTYSPYCIPIELILRYSDIPYELVNLHVGDPRPVIQLTKGEYYQVPVLEDLFSHEIVYDKSPAGDDVPRYISNLAPLMQLFPEHAQGLQKILVSYIENECEAFSFKVCDAYRERWIRSDIERGLHRRHKERKFGVGCLEEWTRTVNTLIEGFHAAIQPFEQILARQPFLTGDRPVYADFALCGVIGNFLFPGNTSLPANNLMLEAWYTKMRAGNFRNSLDEVQMASHDQFSERADQYGKSHILADVSDVEKALADLKLRPGTQALDVATGNGHTAIYLAGKGLSVTACDISAAMLKQAEQLAAEKGVKIAFHEHAAEKLPYADNSFGLITCRVAAHHFSSPETFIRESFRVLKTYGYLVLIDGTVPDDQIEANEWMNTVEKLRDPSHVRMITPNMWRKWCVDIGMTVTRVQVESFKQPDLNWYFNVANTPPENRKKVLEMLAKAPSSARELFKIGQEDGKIVWYWRRLTLIAGKM
jgi:ubiquinone/menaquinone biosynthesis C-methylase UbiE/glutathione S-transferase